ncbi:MAG: tetratricopeptide repeat protein [Bradymonadales bacterium]|nr:tetratricopeptide repeat protein [Bradymonadales bacterium]
MISRHSIVRFSALALGLLLVTAVSDIRSQTPDVPSSSDPAVTSSDRLDQAYDLLSSNRSARGLRQLASALAEITDPFELSHLLYLAGRHHQEAGRCDVATARYQELEAAAGPDDPWVGRARFGRAECLMAAGETEAALELFVSGAEALLEPGRRQELAETLVGHARSAMIPSGPTAVPNHALARGLYQLILELEPGGALQDEADHYVAAGIPAGVGGNPDLLLARLRRNSESPWACVDRQALAHLTGDIPVSWYVVQHCEADQAIPAALELDLSWQGQIGIEALQAVLTRFPEHQRIREVKAKLALALIQRDELSRGRELLLEVLDQADGMDVDLALSAAQLLVQRGQGELARELWNLVRENTTRPQDFETVRARWVQTRLQEVGLAQARSDLQGALDLLDLLAAEIPTELARARTLKGQLLAQAGRWEEAEAELRAARVPEASQFLVEILESRGRLQEALPLRQQLGMQGRTEQLDVAVVHPFLSSEEPYLLARTDALSRLEVRFRRIDVQDHLRSMGTLHGLDALDIDLIAPEVTRTVTLDAPTLEGEQQAGPTYGPIPLGAMAPGVYAVQVVGQTRQATTILTISDIALVARNVGGDLVVLVVDRTRGEPIEGARVLVSDGTQILAEGQTDRAGLYQTEVHTGALEVLAVRRDDVSWVNVQAVGGQTAVELNQQQAEQRRVQLWIDRTLAIPGERIAYLAMVTQGESPRRLVDGTAAIQLFSGGELIDSWEETMVGGLVQGSFPLPRSLPAGRCELAVEGERRAFLVGQEGAPRPLLRVTQEAPSPPLGPARFLVEKSGPDDLPVAGVEIHGDLQDGLGQRSLGRTDENGRLWLSVPLVAGLPSPAIQVEGISYPIEMADDPSDLSFTLPDLTGGTAAPAEISWTGGQDALGFLSISSVPSASQPITPPAITPSWWPVQAVDSRIVLEHVIRFQLAEGQARVDLPPLDPGRFQVDVELIRPDGRRATTSRQVEVVEPSELMEIQTPDQPRADGAALELQVQQDLRLLPRSPGRLPMLLTIEGVGIWAQATVGSGREARLTLPEGMIGPGRLTLTRFDESRPDDLRAQSLVVEIPIEVARRIDLSAAISEGPERSVEVSLTDHAGQPVQAPVFISLLPAEWELPETTGDLFPSTLAALAAQSAWSQVESLWVSSTAVDQEILELQAELAYRQMPADVIDLDQWAESEVGGLYGIGSQGLGYGGGGAGVGRGQARMPQVQLGRVTEAPNERDISPRHHPALWTLAYTDATGHLVLPIERGLIDRGHYHLTAVALEGLGAQAERSRPAGHNGTMLSRSLWLGEPLLMPPGQTAPVWASTREYRRMLTLGERVSLEASGAQWLEVEVSGPSPQELIAVLLAPDLAFGTQAAYWAEQVESMDFVRSFAQQTARESWTTAGVPGVLRWIAGRRLATARGVRPLSAQDLSTILAEIERLAEPEVAQRAEALVGLGRRSPGHSQGMAALLRLARTEGARQPDVVGTLALAMLLLDPDNPQTARTLLPDLSQAAQSASLLGRARAIEALVRLGETPPVDPRALLAELPVAPVERGGHAFALALGSLARSLLATGHHESAEPPVVQLRSSRLSVAMPPGTYLFPCPEDEEAIELVASGAPMAIRVSLISDRTDQTGTLTISRTAQRHGPWFRGEEIVPPAQTGIGPASQGVAGRRLRVRLELAGPMRDETEDVVIEEILPPGSRLVAGSVEGAELLWSGEGRAVFLGRLRFRLAVSYVVELLQPTEQTPPNPLPAVSPDWPAALVRGANGTALAVGSANTLTVVDRQVELADRLAGEVIWPSETSTLSVPENLSLGFAIERATETSRAQQQRAFDLLLPLLEGGRLNAGQVSSAGEAAFHLALALEDDTGIRNVFGILESRAPRATVTQEQLWQVARLFYRQGEGEYALRAYRALLNLRFLAEVAAGERLIDLGQPALGLRLVHDLTRAYPDIPSVVDSVFNVPQIMLNLATNLPDTAEGRFQARRYRRTASRWLAEYLIRYGTEERAAQAALIQLNTLVDLEHWSRLVQLSSAFLERYQQTEFVDSFLYLKAYGQQRQGDLDEAITLYRRVAEEQFDGQYSTDRDRARLAIAQIHHARGELTQARELYEEIRNEFPDAESALATLELAELRAPAVVEGAPGPTLDLPIRVRDVEQLQMWVYEVDLERLFLREKQVRAVEDISLAGIEPVLEREIELPANHGTLAEHTVQLDLPRPGAYLVLLRGPTVRASSLAIVTDLRLDIVEDLGSGSLQIWVTDRRGRPQQGARIRAAMPYAGYTTSQVTDLRGLARLQGYGQDAHILAQAGDTYAVYRGAEQDGYALPSQIYTSGYAAAPLDFEDSLIEGQMRRAIDLQMDNEAVYEQNVLRNRRQESNFELE